MLKAVLLCPPVAGSSGFGQGICRAARGATVCGDVGYQLLAQAMKLRCPRIGTQRISPASGCHQGADPPERGVARTASRHPKNPEHFSRERAPALPLDASSHPGGEQPGRTGTAPAGDRQENQLWIAVRARLEDARGAHASVLHTLNKQTENLFATFTRALDALTINPTRNLYQLLFNSS